MWSEYYFCHPELCILLAFAVLQSTALSSDQPFRKMVLEVHKPAQLHYQEHICVQNKISCYCCYVKRPQAPPFCKPKPKQHTQRSISESVRRIFPEESDDIFMKAERTNKNWDFWNQKPLTGETVKRDDWKMGNWNLFRANPLCHVTRLYLM